jgi:hypothetical protein
MVQFAKFYWEKIMRYKLNIFIITLGVFFYHSPTIYAVEDRSSAAYGKFQSVSCKDLDHADMRLQVSKGEDSNLLIQTFNKNRLVFGFSSSSHIEDSFEGNDCTLRRLESGFVLTWIHNSGYSISFLIHDNGNIIIENQRGTNYQNSLTWGIKTYGKVVNLGLSSFFRLYTEARELHNFGVLQMETGTLRQNYLFNLGVLHFGLSRSEFGAIDDYQEDLDLLRSSARPVYNTGVIDDYGLLISERGLRISNLTHKVYGAVNIQGELKLENAGVENHRQYIVQNPITSSASHIYNKGIFFAQ